MKSQTTALLLTLALTTQVLTDALPKRFTILTFGANKAVLAKEVHASDLQLWINKPTSSYCPVSVVGSSCSAGTLTSFGGGNTTFGMNSMVPGGQLGYVNTTGSIKYTQAHSGRMDPNSTAAGWAYKAEYSPRFGQLTFWGREWFLACPYGEGEARQIKAALDGVDGKGCEKVHLLVPKDASAQIQGATAWQYT